MTAAAKLLLSGGDVLKGAASSRAVAKLKEDGALKGSLKEGRSSKLLLEGAGFRAKEAGSFGQKPAYAGLRRLSI